MWLTAALALASALIARAPVATSPCARRSAHILIVTDVKDEEVGLKKAMRLLERLGGREIPGACRATRSVPVGGRPPSVATRYLPEAALSVLKREALSVGALRYLDEAGGFSGDVDDETVEKLKALESERESLSAETAAQIRWTRSLVDSEIARLAPSRRAYDLTRGLVLISFQVIGPDG